MPDSIRTVCIVGAGTMGSQIALQCAAAGLQVHVHDDSPDALLRGADATSDYFEQAALDGLAAADDKADILARINRCEQLADAAAGAGIVIEAVTENLDVKRQVFAALDALCEPNTILATNSSSLRISRIESATERPQLVVNTHFVLPVWRHPFVEIMGGSATAADTVSRVRSFMESIGILPVMVRKESTGFVFNRIWRAVKKEALRVVDQGIATVEDVDRTWMIQWETPLGPFALMDQVGLDVIRDIELVYYQESGDPSDAPPALLLDKIERGELGVKTGRGFYEYPNPNWQAPDFLGARPAN